MEQLVWRKERTILVTTLLCVAMGLGMVWLTVFTPIVRADGGTLLLDTSYKDASPREVSPGGMVDYTIVLHNDDPFSQTVQVTVTDVLDARLSSSGSAQISPAYAGYPLPPQGNTLRFVIFPIAPNGRVTITFQTVVTTTVQPGEIITNTATVNDGVGDLPLSVGITVATLPTTEIDSPWNRQYFTEQGTLVIQGRVWTGSMPTGFPQAPHLLPISNGGGAFNQYVVQWESVANAQLYTLQESTDVSFATVSDEQTTSNLSIPYTNKTRNRKYYYRVKALTGNYESRWSNVQSVMVNPAQVSGAMLPSAPASQAEQSPTAAPLVDVVVTRVGGGAIPQTYAATVTPDPLGGAWWDWSYTWTLPMENNATEYTIQSRGKDIMGNYDPAKMDTVTVTIKNIILTTPPTAVTLFGPLTGIVQTAYPFTASVSPPEATLFMTYTWSPAPQSGQGSPFATYRWDTAGRKQISVTAANPGGAVVGYHALTLSARVYLPLVLRGWPQPPGRPTLYPLEKIADGAYRVRWSETPQQFAETYTLQEAPNVTFTSNALTVCLTTQQVCTLTQRSPGTYYYRVRGQNTFGYSEWSNVESVVIPHYPIRCSVQITTTDQAPLGNHNFDTAASIAPYLGQSLLDTADTVPPTTTASIPTRSDFYRLDNALIDYQYTIYAMPDRTTNYNLGIIVYDRSRRPIYTDTDTPGYSASITFIARNEGPYYIEVSQITAQCSGGTYQLLYHTPVAPTPTPIPSTLPVGAQVRFLGSEKGLHLEGVVIASESRAVLYAEDGNTFYPYGVFVVALLDVTNHGLESDLITLTDSFKLQDGAGRKFDMAETAIQQAAADTFDRPSAPFRIQPGFTVPMVFVFDALPGAQGLHLVAVQPW